jgi:hypothetical protein
LHEALVSRPGCCIRRLAGTRSSEVRFTRFLRNDKVTVEAMAAHAAALTRARCAGREVLAIQDTTTLVMGGKRARAAGFGPVGKGGNLGGLSLHPVLAVDAATGSVLGLLDLTLWNRSGGVPVEPRAKRAVADKESQRWVEGMMRATEALPDAAALTVVADRESDIYAEFALRPAGVHLITRAAQNRRIATPRGAPKTLFALAETLPEQGRTVVSIPAAPGRAARNATLALRFAAAVLRRPKTGVQDGFPETVTLTLVEAREIGVPADGTKPLLWRLLTTYTVETVAQALKVIDHYRVRWTIEQLFRTLKTAGFDIEETDIGTPEPMIRFAAAALLASVTIMQLVQARDGTTDEPLTLTFAADEAPLLEAVSARLEGKTERQRNPHPKGSLAFATWVIARLGGWTGYYGKPGPKVLRIGLTEFRAIKFGARLDLHNV